MFGIKKIINSTANSSLKVVASGNFLSAINNINTVKETTIKERTERRIEESDSFYKEAQAIINKCAVAGDFNVPSLQEAGQKLIKAIEFNRNNAEAYSLLANIFYTLGDTPTALKYMKYAKQLNPNMESIQRLVNAISTENLKVIRK